MIKFSKTRRFGRESYVVYVDDVEVGRISGEPGWWGFRVRIAVDKYKNVRGIYRDLRLAKKAIKEAYK